MALVPSNTNLSSCMRKRPSRLLRALALAASVALAPPAFAQDVARLIVKFKDAATKASLAPPQRVERLAADGGVGLRHLRAMAVGAHVVGLDAPVPRADAERLAARLRSNDDVEYVASAEERPNALPRRRRTPTSCSRIRLSCR